MSANQYTRTVTIVQVSDTYTWSATPSWITITADPNTSDSWIITIANNNTSSERTEVLSVTHSNGTNTDSITVTQDGFVEPTPTPSPTNSPIPTATPTNSPIPTATPTNSPIPTATPTNSPIPTATPTNSPIPTATPTNSPIPRPSPTPSNTSPKVIMTVGFDMSDTGYFSHNNACSISEPTVRRYKGSNNLIYSNASVTSETTPFNGGGKYWSRKSNFTSGTKGTSIISSSGVLGSFVICQNECLLEGTKIKLFDGTLVSIEDILIDDNVKSFSIDTMPTNDNVEELLEWSSDNMNATDSSAIVTGNTEYTIDSVFNINNGLIKASPDHLHIIERAGIWKVVKTSSLVVGDSLLSEDLGATIIDTIEEETVGNYKVYKLDVENDDVYVANGIITHNAKDDDDIEDGGGNNGGGFE